MSSDLTATEPGPVQAFDRDEAVRIIDNIRRQTPPDGKPPAELVEGAARLLGRSTKTIGRWIQGGVPEVKSEAWTPSKHDKTLLAQALGNWEAFRHLKQQEDPSFTYTTKTIARGFTKLLTKGQLQLLRPGKGAKAFQQNTLVLTEPEGELSRNQVWEIDAVDLPFRVRLRRDGRPRKVWGVVIIDRGSRLLLEMTVVPGRRPNRGDVMAAIGSAIAKYGVPDAIHSDNGLEFLAKDTLRFVVDAGSVLVPMRANTPEHKGVVERMIRTLQEFLATRERLPQYVEGPRKRNGELYGANLPALLLPVFVAAVQRTVVYYNIKHEHSSLGGETPQSRWDNDPRPLQMLPLDELRRFRLAGEERRVTRHGVRFQKRWFVAPDLNTLMGERVEVRYFPNDLRTVEIYTDGRHLCTAVDVQLLGPEGRRAILASRSELLKEITDIRGEATRLLRAHHLEQELKYKPITSDGEIEQVPAKPIDTLEAKIKKLKQKPARFGRTDLWLDGRQAA